MAHTRTSAQATGLGLGLGLLLALAIAATSLLALRLVVQAGTSSTLALSLERLGTERMRRGFEEKLAAGRGLAYSGSMEFLQPRQEGRRRFLEAASQLEATLEDPRGRALVHQALVAEELHEEAALRLEMRGLSGIPYDERTDRIRQTVTPYRTQAEEALDALQVLTRTRLEGALLQAERANRLAYALVLPGAALGLLLAMGLGWVLARPLARLHRESHATEERFRLMLEQAQDYALLLLDGEGRVTSWNAAAQRLFGWRAEEILGHPRERFRLPAEVRGQRPARELERAASTGRVTREGWLVRKSGERFWAEVLLTALYDPRGRLQGYAEVCRDITERKRRVEAERLLAEAGRTFNRELAPEATAQAVCRLVVPALAEGAAVFVLEEPGVLVPLAHVHPSQEPALCELLARSPPSPRDAFGPYLALSTRRSERLLGQQVWAHARGAHQRALLEVLAPRALVSVPLLVGERCNGVLLLFFTSEAHEVQDADVALLEEVAARAAVALDNSRHFHQAQQALELIGVASHDVGNALLNLQLQLLRLRRMAMRDGERVEERLAAAEQQARHLGQMLHNLLDFSRLSAGSLSEAEETVDVGHLVAQVADLFREQADAAGSPLRVEVQPEVWVRWDRLRLERIVANLLSNALKFGRGHPVQVRVWAAQGRAWLEVCDQGVGISPEAQERIFQRFERDTSAERKEAGVGLGLYIVRQLVEARGGRIRVSSVPGKGATFTVELPLEAAQTSPSPPGRGPG